MTQAAPIEAMVDWNISMVNAPRAWQRATGRGIKVAVLDTGIDEDHPDLPVAGGISFVGGVTRWNDDNGSGTHCAGIIGARNSATGAVGVAPECELYAVKVLNGGGSGGIRQVIAGLAWCALQRMDVVIVGSGLGAQTADEPCLEAFRRAAVDVVAAGGVLIAAPGGSRGTTRPWVGQPARCPGFIAVAAVDRNATVANFSSAGPGNIIALAAPGVRIRSTYNDGGYRELSGTARSACHAAGAAALLKEINPGWDATQIRGRLMETARELGPNGPNPDTGAGLLDCSRAVSD